MAWGFSNNNHEQSVLHKIKYYSTAQNFEGRKFCGIHCFLSKQKNYFCEKEKTAAIHMAKIIYACNTQILFQQNFNKKLRKLQPTKYLRYTIDNIITIYEDWDWQKKKKLSYHNSQ